MNKNGLVSENERESFVFQENNGGEESRESLSSYECFAPSLTAFSVMKLNDETSVWIKQYGLTPLISKFHEFR